MLLDSLMFYIKEHITEEIPLERLEQEFNISRRHIQREFKKGTGQTVHSYIVKTKLALCARYIAEGMPVSHVYAKAGFAGYNHFFRQERISDDSGRILSDLLPGKCFRMIDSSVPEHLLQDLRRTAIVS